MFFFGISSTKDVVDNARAFGSLDSSSVWAFFALIFLGYIFWMLRQSAKSNLSALEVRLKQAEADLLCAQALDKVADYLEAIMEHIEKSEKKP